MPVQIVDGRIGGFSQKVTRGVVYTHVFTPDDGVTGDWTYELGDDELTPVVSSPTVTVEIDTADFGRSRVRWTLLRDGEPYLRGYFFPTDDPTDSPDTEEFLVTAASEVAVTVVTYGTAAGLPAGGTTGQVLGKASDDDGDVEWIDQTGGGGGGEVTQAELDAEASARASADTALDGRLDTIEAISIATDAELAAAVAAEAALARDAGNLTSGTVADARIPGTIARDTEVQGLIDAAINALLDGAPAALDTLNELAAAVNDDATFAASVTSALAGKQPLDSDLSAIAALTTLAYGRSLLEAADATALRVLAGLVLGTDIYSKGSVDSLLGALQAEVDAIDSVAVDSPLSIDNATDPTVQRIKALGVAKQVALLTGATVTSTAAETTILASTFDFAALELAVGDCFRAIAGGTWLNNTGGGSACTFRLKADSTNIATFLTPTLASSATARAWRLEAFFRVLSGGVTANGSARFTLAASAGATTDEFSRTARAAAVAFDTTQPLTMNITTNHGDAGSNMVTVGDFLAIERIKNT